MKVARALIVYPHMPEREASSWCGLTCTSTLANTYLDTLKIQNNVADYNRNQENGTNYSALDPQSFFTPVSLDTGTSGEECPSVSKDLDFQLKELTEDARPAIFIFQRLSTAIQLRITSCIISSRSLSEKLTL